MSTSAIKIVVIENPFDPVNSSTRGHINYEDGKSFADYMGDVDHSWSASLNGETLEREQWHLVQPRSGDTIVVSAIPYGGDSGGVKSVLRLVAVVALSYFTGPGSAFAAQYGAVASAGAMIGGTLVANLVFAQPTPEINDDRDISDSPTYGQDRAKNTSESGIPIPLVYGGYRVAGNIIGSYVENVNDEQFLYVLYNAGEGEIGGIENILVNDQPVANFNEVSYQTRNGTADQPLIGWFEGVRRQFNVNSTLSADVWRTYTFHDLSDRGSLEITFPSGLYGVNRKKGNKYTISVELELQYRIYDPNQGDDDGWQLLPWVTDNGTETRANYTVSGRQTSAVRRTIKTGDLGDNSTFEFRVKRTRDTDSDYIIDECTLATVTEISKEKVRYKHTALLALRILMTEQLNSAPTVTYINKGIICGVYNSTTNTFERKVTKNPAWITYDILTNKRYGAGLNFELVRVDKFIEWAAWCDDQNLTFEGVLDTASNAFEILEPVLRLGHAKLFTTGSRVSVTVERPDYPVMMFSQANMIKDTFTISWMPVAERANEIEVAYYDKNYNYEQRTVKVYDDIALQNNEPQRPTSFTLVGCTDEATAFYEGLLTINYNKYITQTYTFDTSVDAIACTLGSVVYIQHDMPQWGYSGRLRGVNTVNAVNIDIDPTDMESEPDIVMVHHSSLSKGKGKIIRRTNNIIDVDFVLPDKSASRIVIAGRDYPVGDIDIFSSYSRITLRPDLLGFVNEPVELFATDVFEERNIADISGNVITVDSPFSKTPDKYSQYLIGRNESVKKKARVLSIGFSDDHTRTISAIEYNETVYDKDIPFAPSPVQPDLGVLGDTELSNIDEELIQIGKVIRPRVTITYRNSSTRYQTSQVFISENGGPYRLVGTHRREITYESEDKKVLNIKLVPVDSAGITRSIESVDPIEYTVLGKTAPPAQVENFTIAKEVGGIQLSWNAVDELDIEGYEVRRGTSWGDGELVAPAINSTVLFFPVSEPGAYEFMVRAVDTTGNLSEETTYASIELIRPERVYNFNAVQHIDKIIMQWDRPLDRNITSFWIREGESWANSYIHGSVTGTSFEVQATKGANRTFWIKAVDIIGIDSEEAVFSNTQVTPLPDRNVIYELDHGGSNPAPGIRLNVSGSNPITMIDGVNYAEYSMSPTLPRTVLARNSADLNVGVLVRNTTTWGQARYTWQSAEANSGWAGVGDPEKIDFQQFLAEKVTTATFYPNTSHLWSLNNVLTDDVDPPHNPSVSTGVSYAPARYNNGAVVGATTNVRWAFTGTDGWTVCSWVLVPTSLTEPLSGVAGRVLLSGQEPIYFILSAVTRQIIMRQRGFPDLAVDDIEPHLGDVYFVSVSQDTEGIRTLRVRNMAEDMTRKATLDVGGIMRPTGVALGFA